MKVSRIIESNEEPKLVADVKDYDAKIYFTDDHYEVTVKGVTTDEYVIQDDKSVLIKPDQPLDHMTLSEFNEYADHVTHDRDMATAIENAVKSPDVA